MVLTCMRELEALPRLVNYVEVRGPDSQPFMVKPMLTSPCLDSTFTSST